MSATVKISVDALPAQEQLAGLKAALGPQGRTAAHKVLGRELQNRVQDWFSQRNREPNKRGWPKQNFWDRIRRATAFASADAQGATVVVADPAFGFKVTGGTIRPRGNTRALAIPLEPDVYGTRPRELRDSRIFVWRNPKTNKAFLARKEEGSDKLRLLYLLLRRVTQKADPDAMPPESQILQALSNRFARWLQRRTNQGGRA